MSNFDYFRKLLEESDYDFFLKLLAEAQVEGPKKEDRTKKYINVFEPDVLDEIMQLERTGVYQLFGFRSDHDVEELLYVGKSKKRDIGVRVYEQLKTAKATFRGNIKKANYIFCEDKEKYEKLKDVEKVVYVERVEVTTFPHSSKAEVGRDITEILLIHSKEKLPIFNNEFTDSSTNERLSEEENFDLFKHQHYDGVAPEEIESEGLNVGDFKQIQPDLEPDNVD